MAKPGDVTDIPKLALNGQDNFDAVSSRYLYKGDFIRLKDITLGYSLPQDFLLILYGVTGFKLTVRELTCGPIYIRQEFKI